MGIVDKFKNLFTEEVEEEVKPIKKEVRHVEIPSPKRETRETKMEPTTERVSDSSAVNKEEKFVFPVYFDDKDFDDLEKPKKEKQPVKKDIGKVEAYQGPKMQKVERRFEASPIISPVYGILDKNYKKEDISTRQEQPSDYTRKPKPMTVDDIRNKAFGTLEDDLEDTLFGNKSILFRDEEAIEKESDSSGIDIFEELHFDENKESMENNHEPKEETLEASILDHGNEANDILSSTEDDLDEDTIMLARQLEEQKKKLEQINEYISENSMEEDHPKELMEDLTEESRSRRTKELNEDTDENSRSKRSQQEESQPEDLTESELLSLVDAMYEKRDEE